MASKTQMGVRLNMTLLYLIRRLVTGGNLTRCERCMASFDKMHFSLLCIQHVYYSMMYDLGASAPGDSARCEE